jgi:hypothetical protein
MSHFYDNGMGSTYPSVTTIISAMTPEPPGITSWKRNNKNWEAQLFRKSTIGTVAHYRILKRYAPAGVLPLPDLKMCDFPADLAEKAEIAEMMFNSLDLKLKPPYLPEYTVLCHKYKYAGQLDLHAFLLPDKRWNGREGNYVFDLKTSNAVHETYEMQLAAYRNALEEMHPATKVAGAAIINIHPFKDKNPFLEAKITFFDLDQLNDAFAKFKCLAEEYHNLNTVD